MLAGRSTLFSLVLLSCLSLSIAQVPTQHSTTNTHNTTPQTSSPSQQQPTQQHQPTQASDNDSSDVPECAAKCMSIKLTEAAKWFGHGDIRLYCTHREFLLAYNNCLHDNCPSAHIEAGTAAGIAACGNVKPINGPGAPENATVPNGNATSGVRPPLSGPATAPGDTLNSSLPNGTALPTTTANKTSNNSALGGALTPSIGTNTSTAPTSRFSNVSSPASANAPQSAANSIISSSAHILVLLVSIAAGFLLTIM